MGICPSILFLQLSVSAVVAQSLTPITSSSSVRPGCSSCILNPAAEETTVVGRANDTASPAPTNTYIFCTAYSITSEYYSQGTCVTTQGYPVSLDSAFSVLVPATNDPLSFASSVSLQFQGFIGFSTCGGGELASFNLPGAASGLSTAAPIISSSPASSATATAALSPGNFSSPTGTIPFTGGSDHELDTKATFTARDKAAIGGSVPVTVITIAVIVAFAVLRRRRRARKKITEEGDSPSAGEESQPYLQQKAELEAKEKQKLELEARERRYELDGELTIHEAPDQGSKYEIWNEDPWPSLQVRQELRGEEHSLELQ